MEKILVAGGTGLVGKPVVNELLQQGFEVVVITRKPENFKKDFEGEAVTLIKANVRDKSSLERIDGSFYGMHLSIGGIDEFVGTKNMVSMAGTWGVKKITYVSGTTVEERNRWFHMIENKYQSEQAIIKSGIQYTIFRPTWFFESLHHLVQNGKANVLGNQKHPFHWVAASDFAKMVAKSYKDDIANEKILFIHGPEKMLMRDALIKYCTVKHPEIKKVNTVPIFILKLIAFFGNKKKLKLVVGMFAYFEKVKEMGDPEEANRLLGKPMTTIDKWLKDN